MIMRDPVYPEKTEQNPYDPELVAQFDTDIAALTKLLKEQEIDPTRILGRYDFYRFEGPMDLPDDIQRYREVGVALQHVSVAMDLSDDDVLWTVSLELGNRGGNFTRNFTVKPTDDGQYFISGDIIGADRPLTSLELTKMLISLTLAKEQREKAHLNDWTIQIDATNPINARLLLKVLQQKIGTTRQETYYYDIACPLKIDGEELTELELIVSQDTTGVSSRLLFVGTKSDGHVEKTLRYEVSASHGAIETALEDADIKVATEYPLEVYTITEINIGDGIIAPGDSVDENTVLEVAVVTLKQLLKVYGAVPELPTDPTEIRYQKEHPNNI